MNFYLKINLYQRYEQQNEKNQKYFKNHIQDHHNTIVDYSQETDQKERQNLMNKIAKNKGIIKFIKCLVHITTMDEKFIQCEDEG
ncbi:unnamed protein product [Paramecium pentaurelia]|uniref:Uncharacterized protein n=1 Tax=Paramecium pentaurelia TaxID=43138 RepID=A0A8S1UNB5_9CILI|nr:unnamed protein product [Paramecium pentaurelia]